jgi:membrane protein required for colicin V production
MNWLDIVLGVILAASTAAGFAKGLVRTAIGITAAILAVVLSLWFYGTAGGVFKDYVASKSIANFLGFVIVFALVILAGALTGKLLAMLFKKAGLSWLDRTLGGCFGLLRGLLVSIIIVMILTAFSLTPPPSAVVESSIAPYVIDASRMISKIAPHELTEGFQLSYDKIRKLWAGTMDKATLPPVPSSH